jgi:hypothetical protein
MTLFSQNKQKATLATKWRTQTNNWSNFSHWMINCIRLNTWLQVEVRRRENLFFPVTCYAAGLHERRLRFIGPPVFRERLRMIKYIKKRRWAPSRCVHEYCFISAGRHILFAARRVCLSCLYSSGHRMRLTHWLCLICSQKSNKQSVAPATKSSDALCVMIIGGQVD